jgi:hypothetical protein
MQGPAQAMQVRIAAVLLGLCMPAATAVAGEYTSVEIGHTGEHLRNSAVHQDKLYEGDAAQEALLGRIGCLMADVDRLLYRLHALPPEISVDPPVMQPVDTELALLYKIGLRENPALAVPRAELAVLAAQTRQEGAPEDPMLSVELMDLAAPMPLLFDPQMIGMEVGVSQLLNTYGKRGLRRSIAQREEGLKELELAQMELDLLMEITNAYYDLMGTQAGIRALDANIELMGILLELAGRKYALGLTPQSMLLNAQVQLTLMEKERIEMRTMAEQQGAALDGLLGHPTGFDWHDLSFDAAYPVPPRIEWNTPQLLQTTFARRPDYQALEQQKDQQQLRVELAHREYHPDVTVMGGYETSRMSQDTLRVGIEFPLLLNKEERQDAAVQEQYAGIAVLEDRPRRPVSQRRGAPGEAGAGQQHRRLRGEHDGLLRADDEPADPADPGARAGAEPHPRIAHPRRPAGTDSGGIRPNALLCATAGTVSLRGRCRGDAGRGYGNARYTLPARGHR